MHLHALMHRAEPGERGALFVTSEQLAAFAGPRFPVAARAILHAGSTASRPSSKLTRDRLRTWPVQPLARPRPSPPGTPPAALPYQPVRSQRRSAPTRTCGRKHASPCPPRPGLSAYGPNGRALPTPASARRSAAIGPPRLINLPSLAATAPWTVLQAPSTARLSESPRQACARDVLHRRLRACVLHRQLHERHPLRCARFFRSAGVR